MNIKIQVLLKWEVIITSYVSTTGYVTSVFMFVSLNSLTLHFSRLATWPYGQRTVVKFTLTRSQQYCDLVDVGSNLSKDDFCFNFFRSFFFFVFFFILASEFENNII